MNKRNRVVITGMGILAPNGIGIEAFWESLLAGRSGIGPITLFDATGFKNRIAGEVKDFNPLDYIEPELKPKRWARHTQLAYAATMMALRDAGLDSDNLKLPSLTPVIIGVSMNAMDVIERAFYAVSGHGPNRMPPTTSAASIPQAPANVIADRLGAAAHATTVSSACTSGLDAVADAAAMIRFGETEIAIAGGTDAPITPLVMGSFIASGLVCHDNGDSEGASRPFDWLRKSGVLSEGAGIFIMENLERALARGARIYMELTGFAKRRDFDPTKPASALADSMELALANAQITINEVDYISAYGPGDPVLDAAEVVTIKDVFADRAYSIPVSSIKGVTGNPLAAGGPFQVAACALSIRDQIIAPTANYQVEDPNCDLDFVPNRARKTKLDCALINVRGLGGSASTLVVNRVPS
ncbi:MAG TPA: beta-ketoacyl-[acyl-carrier-protein] synthase family protein [Chthoniobacterales bacterium]|jgi:3-oxoacyl-[acyl-carrier-protein] synthase II|nr:beta-ketoacyl-[acyl-carrier-protein] synthase family protein [Chthoniobacterales bacterium]